MDHFEEGASWENHAPPKCGICSHSCNSSRLEKCVVLLHLTKLVIISKGVESFRAILREKSCRVVLIFYMLVVYL